MKTELIGLIWAGHFTTREQLMKKLLLKLCSGLIAETFSINPEDSIKPDGTGWKTCQKSVAIVQSGQNKSLNKELCSMFQTKGLIFLML